MKKSILLIFILLFSHFANASDFITIWDLSKAGSGTNQITFGIETNGFVAYTWETIPTGTSGSGTFSGNVVTISGLPTNSMIRLSIDSANFHRISNISYYTLIDIEQWGTINWTNMANAFYECKNLNISASDIPNLEQVNNLSYMFAGCTNLNGPTNINYWNTSNIKNMQGMFNNASSFNQPIGNWNTSNTSYMNSMFQNAETFNQPLKNWNTQQVVYMNRIFQNATSFNQDINNWNIENVSNFSSAFSNATSFNQCLGKWKFNYLVKLENMLDFCGLDCNVYAETLDGWSKSTTIPQSLNLGVANLQYGINASIARTILVKTKKWKIEGDSASVSYCMPSNCLVTLWDLSGNDTALTQIVFETIIDSANGYLWETIPSDKCGVGFISGNSGIINDLPTGQKIRVYISPTNLKKFGIPNGIYRNRLIDIEQWGDMQWTDMLFAFEGCENLNISAKDIPNISGVENMSYMFKNCKSLNGPKNINKWNTSNVKEMRETFYNAFSFNQELSNWDLKNVTDLNGFFDYSGIDCKNYANTLNAWATNPNTPSNINFGAVNIHFGSTSYDTRATLINSKNWNINGDIFEPSACNKFIPLEEETFTISPNPSYNFASIDFRYNQKTVLEIKVLNAVGTMVFRDHMETYPGISKYNIETSHLPDGIYSVYISYQNQSLVKKLVVAH